MKKILAFFSSALLLFPALALSAYQIVPETLNSPEDLEAKIVFIGNWLFTILLVLAVIFIVLAAYKYLMSGGGEEVGAAHKMLLYAAVAVAVALLARGMVEVVKKLVTSNAPATTDSGSTGGSTGTPKDAKPASDPAQLPFVDNDGEHPFDAIVQKCSDGEVPGVVITYSGGDWRNFPDVMGTTGEEGSPNIPKAGNPSINAGKFRKVGYFSTGLANMGTRYDVSVETCNDDGVPVVLVDESQNGNYVRVTNSLF
jgi:hypothetical protein